MSVDSTIMKVLSHVIYRKYLNITLLTVFVLCFPTSHSYLLGNCTQHLFFSFLQHPYDLTLKVLAPSTNFRFFNGPSCIWSGAIKISRFNNRIVPIRQLRTIISGSKFLLIFRGQSPTHLGFNRRYYCNRILLFYSILETL